MFRPPKTVHCQVCDYCIEKFDHHCPWIGTCIGKRNYVYFMVYILLSFVHFSYCVFICVVGIIYSVNKIQDEQTSGLIYANLVILILFCLLCFVLTGFVVLLFFTHVFLIFTNQTTAEYLKKDSSQKIVVKFKKWV